MGEPCPDRLTALKALRPALHGLAAAARAGNNYLVQHPALPNIIMKPLNTGGQALLCEIQSVATSILCEKKKNLHKNAKYAS